MQLEGCGSGHQGARGQGGGRRAELLGGGVSASCSFSTDAAAPGDLLRGRLLFDAGCAAAGLSGAGCAAAGAAAGCAGGNGSATGNAWLDSGAGSGAAVVCGRLSGRGAGNAPWLGCVADHARLQTGADEIGSASAGGAGNAELGSAVCGAAWSTTN